MANILVVGGSGFVGQHLVKELCKNNHNITVLCRKRRHNEYIDIERLPNVKLQYGVDTSDYNSLKRYFKNMDIVVNLAGFISFNQKDKEELIQINHKGTLNVINACEENSAKKVIHLSSTAALGFSHKTINESHEFDWSKHKKCVYSYSKYLSNDYIQKSKCNSLILFPPLILGPGDKANTLKLLKAIRNEKMPFNPPGRNSYIDVRDLVSAIIFLLDKNFKKDQFIVISENYSFKEMNSIIAKELNSKSPSRVIPKIYEPLFAILALLIEKIHKNPPITYENIFMAFQNRVHSSDKIMKLGWKPKYELSQTVRDSWNWIEGMNHE